MIVDKKIRKHRGIRQTGGNKGKLKKGYKYSGKRFKNGKAEIVQVGSMRGLKIRSVFGMRSKEAIALSGVEEEREKIRQELHELMEKEKKHEKTTTQDVKDKARELNKNIPYKQRLEKAKDIIGKEIKKSIENKQEELKKNAVKVKEARRNKAISKGETVMTREQEKKRTGKAQKKMQDIMQQREKKLLLNNSLLDDNAENAGADMDKHIRMLQENANNLQEKQDNKMAILRNTMKYNNNNSNNSNNNSNNSNTKADKLVKQVMENANLKKKLGGKKNRKPRKTRKTRKIKK